MFIIQTLPVGKALAQTAEFYKHFVLELAPLMLQMYLDSLKRLALANILSSPSHCICNNRIFSNVFVSRLNEVVSSLVHPHSVGFILYHSTENIQYLINVMWSVGKKTAPISMGLNGSFSTSYT